MNGLNLSPQKLYGLLELDAAGVVLYSRLEGESSMNPTAADLGGHNFYSEVAPFLNISEFHQRLDAFNCGSEQATSFVFNFDYEDGAVVPVRVLLASIRERTNGGTTKSLLVHIKKVD